MKILLINNQHHLAGGAHRVYFNTGKLLEKKGHDVAYFSTKDEDSEVCDYSRYFVDRIDYKGGTLWEKLKSTSSFIYDRVVYDAVTELISDFKPDIAHIHLFYGGLTVSVINALKDNNIPIVHTVHDYKLICPAYTFIDRNNKICEKCKNGKFYNCAKNRCSKNNLFYSMVFTLEAYYWKYKNSPIELIDHFIFVSKFIKSKHIEFDSVFKGKSSHIYNFHKTDELMGRKIKRGDYLFYYGRLDSTKGLITLLKVVSENGIPIKIAGTGPLKDVVEGYCKKYSNIIYVGFKNGEELFDLVQNSSYVVVPSEWYENNPMTIVESFSLRKPVIASNIGGIPELVLNGKTGFLFEPKNNADLARQINNAQTIDDENYREMSDNAIKFAEENFAEKKHYDELIRIYSNLIKNNKKK